MLEQHSQQYWHPKDLLIAHPKFSMFQCKAINSCCTQSKCRETDYSLHLCSNLYFVLSFLLYSEQHHHSLLSAHFSVFQKVLIFLPCTSVVHPHIPSFKTYSRSFTPAEYNGRIFFLHLAVCAFVYTSQHYICFCVCVYCNTVTLSHHQS